MNKEIKEIFLLILVTVFVVVFYYFLTTNRHKQAKEDLYLKEQSSWNSQAEKNANRIDVSNPNVMAESKNKYFYHYVSFKEYSDVKIPIKDSSNFLKIRDSKHFSIIEITYKNDKCLLGLVSENGVLYEAEFKDVYDKGCIKL